MPPRFTTDNMSLTFAGGPEYVAAGSLAIYRPLFKPRSHQHHVFSLKIIQPVTSVSRAANSREKTM